jgi:predicted dehydrogenase
LKVTRRRFLGSAAATAAVAAGSGAFPAIVPASARGADGATAPSERVSVGMIGVGNQGMFHTQALAARSDAQIVALCDPQRDQREAGRKHVEEVYAQRRNAGSFRGIVTTSDFRELLARPDVDAVFIATPEHWHALTAIAAARAGKDIYLEKAMTVTIAEGQALARVVRRYGRILQVGTQQRSQWQFRLACELVRNGCIGALHTIVAGLPSGYPGPPVAEEPVPEGFDYDMWLGPAPWKPYSGDRVTNLKGWMLTYDYCVGFQAGWGSHHLDIAQWGNGTDHTGPVEVEGRGVFPEEGLNDTPMTWHTEYKYANGVRLVFTTTNENPMGIRFEGADGWVFVNRETIDAHDKSLLKTRFAPGALRLYRSDNHHDDFLDCVRTRKEPICPVEVGHRTTTLCNLSDISIRLGRKLRWDPDRERFINDDEATRLMARATRAPWQP